MNNKMTDLVGLGGALRKIDKLVVDLLAQRMRVAKQVEEFKHDRQQPIYRGETESERMKQAHVWASGKKIGPSFAPFVRALFYFIIGESCKTQMIQWQDAAHHAEKPEDEEAWYAKLKNNLIALAEQWAPIYDAEYDRGFSATRAYKRFESDILSAEIALMKDRKVSLDIGCATGIQSLRLVEEYKFGEVIGFDISSAMIRQAKEKFDYIKSAKSRFEVRDVENGIPLADSSVSLVLMNFGTASDLRKVDEILKEVRRVLIHDGIAFLSFYNRDALPYKMEFLPWDTGLVAEINISKNCLDVHAPTGELLSIYARPYTTEEIEAIMPSGMSIRRMLAYPAIASILPDEIFEDELVQKTVIDIDKQLAETGYMQGAYLIAIAKKTS